MALEIRDISYSYPDGTVALQNLTFSVAAGDKIAVLGPNGAGKSTLLKIVAGLILPDSGSVLIDGETLTRKNADVLRRRMGVLFQDPDDQIFMPRVWDDVAFGPVNLGLSEGVVHARVDEALSKVHLEGMEQRVPHHMSYGEKKRIAIAGVLAMRPEILLLDEPTANLDPSGRAELIEILEGLENTMIIATHDVNVASMMVERAMVLNKRKMAEGSLREIFSRGGLLERANLRVPDIAKLFLMIEKEGVEIGDLPLSVEEGARELSSILRRRD